MKNLIVTLAFLLVVLQLMAQAAVYPKDITVAQDGSGNYKTIQDAVNSVRDLGQRVTIHIKKGIYHEKLVIPAWKTLVTLVGEDKNNTIQARLSRAGKMFMAMKSITHSPHTLYWYRVMIL